MGVLYLVPTPIGNLEDITLRGLRILKEAKLILAEDTRNTGQLLKLLGLPKANLRSYHMHNEHGASKSIATEIASSPEDDIYAMVTDAGTPGISDPAYMLVNACIEEGIKVYCLPGPTAFVPALVQSGMPTNSFVFEGFLPVKKGRQTKLKALALEERTIILYESPHRVAKTFTDLALYFGPERKGAAVREISKLFEETKRGTLQELALYFATTSPRGEFVIVIHGSEH